MEQTVKTTEIVCTAHFASGKPTIAASCKDNLRNQFDAGADWMKEQILKH